MSRLGTLGLLAGFLSLNGCTIPDIPAMSGARADLINADGYIIGEALFAQEDGVSGISLRLQAWDLPAGTHGLHIHNQGACDLPDFETSGGHFNPFGKKHGLKNPEGPHAGDLPNIVVPANGRVEAVVMIRWATLGWDKDSLVAGNGTCIVIHANPDDQVTDPDGNSGARIACGVIRNTTPVEIKTR